MWKWCVTPFLEILFILSSHCSDWHFQGDL